MASILKKTGLLLMALALGFLWAGCSSGGKTSGGGTPTNVRVGIQHTKSVSPQLLYGRVKGVWAKEFPGTNFNASFATGSLRNLHTDVSKLGENMAKSEYDFVYLDSSSILMLLNYGYEKTIPEYTVIAGAQFKPRRLMVNKGFKSLKELDGKTVGIYNKSNDLEMLLNKMLAKEGLKTAQLGGTVKVKYGDHDLMVKDFVDGKIEAFYTHFANPTDLTKLKVGSKPFSFGEGLEFGLEQPYAVLAVRNRFLEENPGFVKKFLEIHVDGTAWANANPKEVVKLAAGYYGNPKLAEPLEYAYGVKKTGKGRVVTTFDPNLDFFRETINFVNEAGYKVAMPPLDKVVDLTILNEVLKEKGQSPVQ